MVLQKGQEYLEIATGVVFRIYHISPHGTQVLICSRKNAEKNSEFVLHTMPRTPEEIERCLRKKEWVPNTPAALALYGTKV